MIPVDTGPLVALCDRRDARQRAADRDLKRLLPRGLWVCEHALQGRRSRG